MQGNTFTRVLAVGLGVSAIAAAEVGLDAVRSPLEQWVQTRQVIARTRADWTRDQEALARTTALYERELASVREQAARFTTNSAFLVEQRAAAAAELTRYQNALDTARSRVGDLELRIKHLAPVFPDVLLATVQPLLNRLPADPATTNVAIVPRVQTVVTLLNELDKFNAAVITTEETRPGPDGRPVAVTVVYLGLGQAWFVNPTGDFAGVGVPGASGWEWTVRNDLAPAIADALRMYRNEVPAAFVAIPARIQ